MKKLRWPMIALILTCGAGAVSAWALRSLVGGLLIGWYTWELIDAVLTVTRENSRRTLWVRLVPRLVGTPLALLVAWLLVAPLPATLALACLLLLVAEGIYRSILRRRRPEWFAAAQPVVERAVPAWHSWAALLCALILILLLPLTLYAYGARQTLADTRFWARGLAEWGLYEEIIDLVGEELPGALRQQPAPIRNAVRSLDEQTRREALVALLPRPWTEAVALQAVEATLDWLQADGAARVPAISVPVGDVIQHAKLALSIALDKTISALPICPPGIAASTQCRPTEMSVVAYTATTKPDALAAIDDLFAMIPPDVDLSTAVTLSPRTFQTMLTSLEQIRGGLRQFDRFLRWAGLACALVWIGAWVFGEGKSAYAGMCWAGMALLVAGARAWDWSWLATAFPPALLAQTSWSLDPPLTELPLHALTGLTQSVYKQTTLLAGLCVLGGLILILIGLKVKTGDSHRPGASMTALTVILALIVIAWYGYVSLGRTWYVRAVAFHRAGDASQAAHAYQSIAALYPFAVDPFVERAHRGLIECQRDLNAQRAFDERDFRVAAQIDKALLTGAPAIALRERAEPRLIAALNAEAEALWEQGHYERAIDLYHLMIQGWDDRPAQRNLADRYLIWGKVLEEQGDYAGAVAIYLRATYDTTNARLWAEARARAGDAYCAWGQMLRTEGLDERAAQVCAAFAQAFSAQTAATCPVCQ
ncbi:MAG: hypothetical protein JW934_04460 [Anaerolineae bacterium]|nr:hypothetical protein [Anaerolineae bacterium]